MGYDHAALAIYELIDLLTPQTACRIAYQNLELIMEMQLPTEVQTTCIQELSRTLGESGTRTVNKRMANELIFELEIRVAKKTGGYFLIGIFLALLGVRYVRVVRKIDISAKHRERAAWLILSLLFWGIADGCFLGAERYDLTGLVSGFEITLLVILTHNVMPTGAWWQFWLWRRKRTNIHLSGNGA